MWAVHNHNVYYTTHQIDHAVDLYNPLYYFSYFVAACPDIIIFATHALLGHCCADSQAQIGHIFHFAFFYSSIPILRQPALMGTRLLDFQITTNSPLGNFTTRP